MNAVQTFDPKGLAKLFVPSKNSSKGQNGQVTIIGGSKLFHGAPILSLTTASRIVDMVYFSSPEPSVGRVAEAIKSKLSSFIWVPWEEIDKYVVKSDAVLIGSGMMRYDKYDKDGAWEETREITKKFLLSYPDKRWVIDAGSLQTLEPNWIPKGSILTPNEKEYKLLFGDLDISDASKKFDCTIVLKRPVTTVCSPEKCVEITGGNQGLTKGGTGDVQAGLTVALMAMNDPFLAASSASFIVKAAADEIQKEKGIYFNADDLASKTPEIFAKMIN